MQRSFFSLSFLLLGGCRLSIEESILYLDIFSQDGQFLAVAESSGSSCPDAAPLEQSTLEGMPMSFFEDLRAQHEGTGEVNANEYGVASDSDSCLGEIRMGVDDISSMVDREKVTFLFTGETETYNIGFFPYPLAKVGVTSDVSLRASTLWGSTVVFTLDAPHDSFGRFPSVDINYEDAWAGHTIESFEDSTGSNTLTVNFPRQDPLDGGVGLPVSLTVYTGIEFDADSPFSNRDPIGVENFYLQLQLSSYVEISLAP